MPKGRGRSGARRKTRPRKGPPNRHALSYRVSKAQKTLQEEQAERPSSASERKLVEEDAEVDPKRKDWSGLRVIDIDKVFSDILQHARCRKCRGKLSITERRHVGLSSVYELDCERCGELKVFRNCDAVHQDGPVESEANRRFLYAAQVLGIHREGMKKFCAIMDFPPPGGPNLYREGVAKIHSAIENVTLKNMTEAAKQEEELTESKDIAVSGDGTWQKRGFSSKNGVVTLVGVKTGKAIDFEVMTTVCYGCTNYRGPREGEEYEEWRKTHQEECTVNHEGSSGLMEPVGAVRMFKRSELRYGLRYVKYIGDGDSKTYLAIVNAKPYGDEIIPSKIECTGHVQKRMGTRLRTHKKSLRGKKLSDGKGIGGAKRLTDKRIDQLSSFYGNAIRGAKDLKSMTRAVWAIFYHYRSTDEKPSHNFCPKGADSWCRYNKAVANGTVQNFRHTNSLPVPVMDSIKPIFKDLSQKDLLERCLGGYTQNPNESLNAVIWNNVPKTVFCGKKVLVIGVCDAVLLFNSGQKSRLQVMKTFGVIPGKYFVNFCNETDRKRKQVAQRRSLDATKEARKAKRQAQKDREESLAEQEGPVYAPGAF